MTSDQHSLAPPQDLGDTLMRMASLTSAQHALLERIAAHDSPVTVTDLAEELNLHVSSVRETLEVLFTQGLVTRRALPPQGRGRPALAYSTHLPVDPSFPAKTLSQVMRSVFAWLRLDSANAREHAREIGSQWADEALAAARVPDHSRHGGYTDGFSLESHMGKIRLFLSAMGFGATPCIDSETSFFLTDCPFADPSAPDHLALEVRRGAVERVLELTAAGSVTVEYLDIPEVPMRARVNLIPLPAHRRNPIVTTVTFYGGAAEAAGADSLQIPADRTFSNLGELLAFLVARSPELAPIVDVSSFLVDGRGASHDTLLSAGARVDVLPPFAGG